MNLGEGDCDGDSVFSALLHRGRTRTVLHQGEKPCIRPLKGVGGLLPVAEQPPADRIDEVLGSIVDGLKGFLPRFVEESGPKFIIELLHGTPL